MSSILKALKKAEQDSSRSVRLPGLTTTPKRFFISKNPDDPPNKFWNSKNIWISCGAVFVAGLSLFLFFNNDIAKPPVSQGKTIQRPPVFKSPEVRVQKEIKQNKKTAPPNPIQKTEPALRDTLPPLEREISLAINTAADPHPQADPKNQISVKETDTPVASLPLEPIKDDIEKEIPDDTSITDGIAELMDENIKIQAISWSQAPEDRIAVINNKIISEKDYIEEYRVVLIQKDEIILSKSGKRYLLRFRYH